MLMERRDLAVCGDSNNMEGTGEMIEAPINLQDLRRRRCEQIQKLGRNPK
jgi:hypothetical protein